MNKWILIAALNAASLTQAFPAQLLNSNHKNDPLPTAPEIVKEAPAPRFVEVAAKAMPATVFIKVQFNQQNGAAPPGFDMFGDEFFRQFFGRQFNNPQIEQQPRVGSGSGFFISPDGFIATNNHVVREASEISVVLEDGREFSAKIVGTDAKSDLAVLKVEGTSFPFLSFGNSDELRIGEDVAAAGNPFGIKGMLTRGIVSAKGKQDVGLLHHEDFIITDAAINPGNSGGPLLNVYGEVVGVNAAMATGAAGTYANIGLCIPSNLASRIIDQLIHNGNVKRAYLGVILQPIDKALSELAGLENLNGVLISEVMKDSPAFKGGILQGDIVLEYNNRQVKSVSQFRNEIAMLAPESEIKLKVLRSGQPMTISFKLGALTEGEAFCAEFTEKLGIEIENLTADYAARLGYSSEVEGVLIKSIKRNSPAAIAGLSQTLLITGVGANLNSLKKVKNKADFEEALKELSGKKHIVILVRHQKFQQYYTIAMN